MHAMATLDMRIVSLEVMVSMREKLFHAHPDRQSLAIHKGYDDIYIYIYMSDPQQHVDSRGMRTSDGAAKAAPFYMVRMPSVALTRIDTVHVDACYGYARHATVSLEVMVSMREQLFHAHPDRHSPYTRI
jgi:hypothetical protein